MRRRREREDEGEVGEEEVVLSTAAKDTRSSNKVVATTAPTKRTAPEDNEGNKGCKKNKKSDNK